MIERMVFSLSALHTTGMPSIAEGGVRVPAASEQKILAPAQVSPKHTVFNCIYAVRNQP
jgi:hypothetical protein